MLSYKLARYIYTHLWRRYRYLQPLLALRTAIGLAFYRILYIAIPYLEAIPARSRCIAIGIRSRLVQLVASRIQYPPSQSVATALTVGDRRCCPGGRRCTQIRRHDLRYIGERAYGRICEIYPFERYLQLRGILRGWVRTSYTRFEGIRHIVLSRFERYKA